MSKKIKSFNQRKGKENGLSYRIRVLKGNTWVHYRALDPNEKNTCCFYDFEITKRKKTGSEFQDFHYRGCGYSDVKKLCWKRRSDPKYETKFLFYFKSTERLKQMKIEVGRLEEGKYSIFRIDRMNDEEIRIFLDCVEKYGMNDPNFCETPHTLSKMKNYSDMSKNFKCRCGFDFYHIIGMLHKTDSPYRMEIAKRIRVTELRTRLVKLFKIYPPSPLLPQRGKVKDVQIVPPPPSSQQQQQQQQQEFATQRRRRRSLPPVSLPPPLLPQLQTSSTLSEVHATVQLNETEKGMVEFLRKKEEEFQKELEERRKSFVKFTSKEEELGKQQKTIKDSIQSLETRLKETVGGRKEIQKMKDVELSEIKYRHKEIEKARNWRRKIGLIGKKRKRRELEDQQVLVFEDGASPKKKRKLD